MTADPLVARVERLREVAEELDDCDTEDEVYDHAVSEAERVLSFESAIAAVAEDGELRPHAVVAEGLIPASPLGVEEGIAGKTFREGETQVVPDAEASDVAVPTSEDIRSVLSIPVEDEGILQFHTASVDAFSETDRRIGDLLAANVSNALERVRYEQALAQERDQFAALFENVPDAALQYRIEEGEQVIEAVNSAFVSTFGETGRDIVGKAVEEVVTPSPDCPEQFVEADVSGNAEVLRETSDGPRPFLLRSVPMRTTDDLPRGYLIYTDLTAQKEREEELQRKNERLDEFAGILSHDLRNPLNVAQLYTEQERLDRDSEELRKAGDALDRIDQLIKDVLTLTRSEQDIDPDPDVDLGRTAKRAWETVETGDATLQVTGRIDCTADRAHLKRLLENLFRNAVEHGSTSPASQTQQDAVEHSSTSPDSLTQQDAVEHSSTSPGSQTRQDGEARSASSSRTQSDDAVEHGSTSSPSEAQESTAEPVTVRVESIEGGFAVEDDGPGIPPDQRDSVFESGYTTGGGNTGLGLAIVERIATTHGWSVEITDGDSGGARFEFRDVERADGDGPTEQEQ